MVYNTGSHGNVHDIALVLGYSYDNDEKQAWVWEYLCDGAGISVAGQEVGVPNESSYSVSGTFDTKVTYDIAIDYTGQTMVDGKLLIVPGQTYTLPVSVIDKHTGGQVSRTSDIAPDAQKALIQYISTIDTANTGLVVTYSGWNITIDATNVSGINYGVLGAGATITFGGGQAVDNKFTYPNGTPYSQWYDYQTWSYSRSGQNQLDGSIFAVTVSTASTT